MNEVAVSSGPTIIQPTLSDVVENRLTQSEDVKAAAAELKELLADHPELDRLVSCLAKLGVIHLYL